MQPRANVEVDRWFRPPRAPTLGRGAPRLDPSACEKAASTRCSFGDEWVPARLEAQARSSPIPGLLSASLPDLRYVGILQNLHALRAGRPVRLSGGVSGPRRARALSDDSSPIRRPAIAAARRRSDHARRTLPRRREDALRRQRASRLYARRCGQSDRSRGRRPAASGPPMTATGTQCTTSWSERGSSSLGGASGLEGRAAVLPGVRGLARVGAFRSSGGDHHGGGSGRRHGAASGPSATSQRANCSYLAWLAASA